MNELFGAVIGVADIRPVTEADLLGRHEIDTDLHDGRRLRRRQAGPHHRRGRIDRQ